MKLDALRTNTNISAYRNVSDSYLRMSKSAEKLGLRDEQTVVGNKSRYELDGSLKDEHLPIGAPKNAEKTDKEDSTNEISKTEQHTKGKHDGFEKDCPLCECETCKKRRYQDDSNDSGVSFQTPTRLDPAAAGARVRGHEMEHVRREKAKADEDGRRIVSQTVQIKTDICEECGKIYVAGGLTRTVSRIDMRDFHSVFMLGFDGEGTDRNIS